MLPSIRPVPISGHWAKHLSIKMQVLVGLQLEKQLQKAPLVVKGAPISIDQSERSKNCLDQSESSI